MRADEVENALAMGASSFVVLTGHPTASPELRQGTAPSFFAVQQQGAKEGKMKKGCSGCLGCFTIVVVIPWIIFLAYYFTCSKSPEQAVKSVSLQDALYDVWIHRFDDEDSLERKTKFLKAVTKEMKKRYNVDMSKSIYKTLSQSKDISNLVLRTAAKINGERVCIIEYTENGKPRHVQFVAMEPALFKEEMGDFKTEIGHATCVEEREELLKAVGPSYGIPENEIRDMLQFFRGTDLPSN